MENVRDVNDTEATRAALKKWMKARGFNGNVYSVGKNFDYACLIFSEDSEGMVKVELETFFDKCQNSYGEIVLYNDGITLEAVKGMVESLIKYMEENMDKKQNG